MALSLPAFAILLQIVVESEIPFTHEAVPTTTEGLDLFLVGGIAILVELVLSTQLTVANFALSIITLGMVSMLAGGEVRRTTDQPRSTADE